MGVSDTQAAGLARWVCPQELNIFEVATHKERLLQSLAVDQSDGRLVLNMCPLEEIDSAGLQLLLAFKKHCGSVGVQVELTQLRVEILDVFSVFGFTADLIALELFSDE